jgi:hypothetical protein
VRILLAIASVFVLVSHCSATAIVAIFQNTAGQSRIVFGVDGLQTLVDGQGKPIDSHAQCKIGRIDSYFYAVAGIVYSPDRSYDVYRELQTTLSGKGSFAEKVKLLEAVLLKELNSTAEWPPPAFVQVFIVNSAEFPNYYIGYFARDAWGQWRMLPRSGMRDSIPMDTRVVVLGVRDSTPPSNDRLNNLLKDAAAAVKQLIREQAAQHPTTVGEPISIVEIKKSGVHWIERGACEQ